MHWPPMNRFARKLHGYIVYLPSNIAHGPLEHWRLAMRFPISIGELFHLPNHLCCKGGNGIGVKGLFVFEEGVIFSSDPQWSF